MTFVVAWVTVTDVVVVEVNTEAGVICGYADVAPTAMPIAATTENAIAPAKIRLCLTAGRLGVVWGFY
jgi:hypothetical protein